MKVLGGKGLATVLAKSSLSVRATAPLLSVRLVTVLERVRD